MQTSKLPQDDLQSWWRLRANWCTVNEFVLINTVFVTRTHFYPQQHCKRQKPFCQNHIPWLRSEIMASGSGVNYDWNICGIILALRNPVFRWEKWNEQWSNYCFVWIQPMHQMCTLHETINLIHQSAKIVSDLISQNFPNKSAFYKINVPIVSFLSSFVLLLTV